MATFKVRALYDFLGEPGTAEMSITAGETLTVTRIDVGEGWWEGVNNKGQTGLFPEAYVEKIEESQPPQIAPPLPPSQTWGTTPQTHEDDWDDEWDNEDGYSEINQGTSYNSQNENTYSNYNQVMHQTVTYQHSASHTDISSESNIDLKGTVTKKSLNRFSIYVKSGLESYILGALPMHPMAVKYKIYKDNDIVYWEQIREPYTVQIASPKKSSKMAGLKSFICYHLTPSFSNIEVARRYKHFDWLQDRLRDKFNIIAIPPLPDKQVSGRYEEQFIEHRRMQLQEFINYMCRHPVLSQSDVWKHFLTCTDEKQWKAGKRNAEKDPLVGANFCLQIEAPDKELLSSNVESTLELSINSINHMDQAIKGLMQIATDQQKKYVNMYKREHTKVGESFFALGSSFESADRGMFSEFSSAIKKIGTTYITIGKLYEEQAKVDWQPLFDKLYIYKGITSSFPDMFQLQKHAEQKKRDCERNPQIQQLQISEIRKRTDVLTYALFSELTHFYTERDIEVKVAIKQFLQEQVNFYKTIVRNLEDTLHHFQ